MGCSSFFLANVAGVAFAVGVVSTVFVAFEVGSACAAFPVFPVLPVFVVFEAFVVFVAFVAFEAFVAFVAFETFETFVAFEAFETFETFVAFEAFPAFAVGSTSIAFATFATGSAGTCGSFVIAFALGRFDFIEKNPELRECSDDSVTFLCIPRERGLDKEEREKTEFCNEPADESFLSKRDVDVCATLFVTTIG